VVVGMGSAARSLGGDGRAGGSLKAPQPMEGLPIFAAPDVEGLPLADRELTKDGSRICLESSRSFV
jgi:hypothetical protein